MFAAAIDRASGFTLPFVALRHYADGAVSSALGSFVVLNAEGWIATSAHLLDGLLGPAGDQAGVAQAAPPDERAVTDHAEIWALPHFEASKPVLVEGRVNVAADLAVGRLEPFDATSVPAYPVLRDVEASPIRQGEAVCRLGFPFHAFPATYAGEGKGFLIADGALPVPRFALEGIVSRFNQRSGPRGTGLYIETSTPGLRGQSGGPLLDVQGRIVGIQSHTTHYDLGFDARSVADDGSVVTERQFLNVGAATHVDEVAALLRAAGVAFERG